MTHIETQLKNRLQYPYKWGKKQNDHWDDYTNFIYDYADWDAVVQAMKAIINAYGLDQHELFNYAANRWYNFWSAMAAEQIFSEVEGVVPALNEKNRLIDFSLFGINFDHKTSVFPKGFKETMGYAQNHEEELLYWLYRNQSQQQRKHFENRLFIMIYAENGAHWKLKAEIGLLKAKIQQYCRNFHPTQLKKLHLPNGKIALADLVWVVV